ncbi:MAG: hypothetical protein QW438_05855 [Ignisphaera sp.]
MCGMLFRGDGSIIYLALLVGLLIGFLSKFRFRRMNISRIVNGFVIVTVFILALLIGIVAGYTIMARLSIIGIQALLILVTELALLTVLPIVIGFCLSLLITRIGRGK